MATRRKTALFSLGALICLLTGAAWADAPPGAGGDRMKARLQKMKEALSLTDDQVSQVETILRDASSQAQADRAKAGAGREALRSLARERHRSIFEKIDALLSEEQKARHAQLRDEFRKKHRQGMKPPGGQEGPET